MGKKILSVFLVLMIVFSMTACGSKTSAKVPESIQEVVDAMGEIDANSIDLTFDMQMGDEGSFGFKMTASNKTNNEGFVDMYVKLSIDDYVVEDYTYVTTVYVSGQDMYINLKSVLDFAASLDEQFAAMAAYIALPGDYLKITMDDFISLYESMGVDISAFSDVDNLMDVSEDSSSKMADALNELLGSFLTELTEKSGTVTLSAGTATFTVDETNVKAFMDALASMDIEKYLNDYAAVIESSMLETAEQIRSVTPGLNAQIAEAADSFNTEYFKGSRISTTFGVKDVVTEDSKKTKEAAVFSFVMNFADESAGDILMDMNMTMTEDKASDYTLPESVMTVEELMTMLSNLGIM